MLISPTLNSYLNGSSADSVLSQTPIASGAGCKSKCTAREFRTPIQESPAYPLSDDLTLRKGWTQLARERGFRDCTQSLPLPENAMMIWSEKRNERIFAARVSR